MQNNLGILWSERDEIKTAQTYLESAEALYNQYMKEVLYLLIFCQVLLLCITYSFIGLGKNIQWNLSF